MPQRDIVVVMTNAPDLLLAKRIAHLLIEERLAACVNIGTPRAVCVWMERRG